MSVRQGSAIVAGISSINYNDLSNKPQINSIELSGNKTLDELSIQSKLTAGKNISIENNTISSIGGGNNIGDIFYTTRTDNSLNGAVECNGSQYNFSDFDSNLQNLLDEGKLPYVSIGEFDSMVTEHGGCDSFGYGTADLVLYPVYIYTGMHAGIQFYTNVSDWRSAQKDSNNVLQGVKLYDKNTYQELVGWYVKYEKVIGLFYIYNPEDESQDINGYMVDSSDTADTITLPTGGEFQPTTYFKVPKKLSRVLVRTQKPTADNNYTWFNIYSDGWVEQGGTATVVNAESRFTLPIEMSDANYTIVGGKQGIDTDGVGLNIEPSTTTQFIAGAAYRSALTRDFCWQVSGYADPAEYTKDKWDYQNVQVERPMVQLFNGATDEAVAKCTEVLSDVAGLKQTTDGMIDYVIESQEPTEANGYTWYRLYKSGWVEQGGHVSYTGFWTGQHIDTVSLPVEFANTNYRVIVGRTDPTAGQILTSVVGNKKTTSVEIASYALAQSSSVSSEWLAVGMSAQGSN